MRDRHEGAREHQGQGGLCHSHLTMKAAKPVDKHTGVGEWRGGRGESRDHALPRGKRGTSKGR
eukprot:scaffold282979_cov32-Tisochrysis_lutea.AAC.9